jgi:hypothetical protein
MTTEQLLAPRYKMIADYPGNSRPIGFIFTMDKKDSEGWYTTTGYLQEMFFTMYPHLFRRLEWWQEREISDLPEYVRLKIDIPYYGFKKGQVCPMGEISEKRDSKFNKHYVTLSGKPLIDLNSIEPATLADYNHYCQQVKQKV